MSQNITNVASKSALKKINSIADRLLGSIESASLVVSCVALFTIMILIFFDGAFRYLFNSPIKFSSDVITLYLMSAGFLSVLSYTLRKGGHINVDLFASMMNVRLSRTLSGIAFLCSVPVVGIMSYVMSELSWESYVQGEVLVGIYEMSLWPSKAIVAAGLIILNLRLLHLGIFNLLSGLTGDDALGYDLFLSVVRIEEESN